MSDTICRSCGTANAQDRDFCTNCGEYLQWNPTTMVAAVGQEGQGETEAGANADAPTTVAAPPGGPDPAAPADDGDGSPPRPGPAASPVEMLPSGELPTTPFDTGETAAAPPRPAGNGAGPHVSPASPKVGVPLGHGVQSALGPISGGAAIFLESPAGAGMPDEVPEVIAGGAIAFMGTIRNQSRIVDNYDLIVAGLPDGWSTVMPPTAYLMPAGSGAQAEQEVRVEIHPPRASEAYAGVWSFELVARSRATGQAVAAVECAVTILPFEQWTTHADPRTGKGRLRARYLVEVRNEGNAPATLFLYASDDDGRVRAQFSPRQLTLQAGEARRVRMKLKPARPIPIGRAVDHRVTVEAAPDPPVVDPNAKTGIRGKIAKLVGGVSVDVSARGAMVKAPRKPASRPRTPQLHLDAATLGTLLQSEPGGPLGARQVVYRQKALVPIWAIVMVILLAAGAYAIYTFWPRNTEVPNVIGAKNTFSAEKKLRAADLELEQPVEREVRPDAPAGSVIGQTPDAGQTVKEGTRVRLQVAVGSGSTEVPRLKGLTRAKADERLRSVGLALGQADPANAEDAWLVKSQIPSPGQAVDRKTLVRVFLVKPAVKKKKGGKAGANADAGGKGGAGGAGKKAKVVVPPINGQETKDYLTALGKSGFNPVESKQIAEAPVGTLLNVLPEPGNEIPAGSGVRLVVSAGTPPVAYETEDLVKVVDPLTRKSETQYPKEDGTGRDPAYTADGKELLFRSEKQVLMAKVGKKSDPKVIYGGAADLEAIAPPVAGPAQSVALIRREEGDGDLCFASLDSPALQPQCKADDGWDLTGPISWRRDGKALLIPARDPENPDVFGIRVYTTQKAFTRDPTRWTGRTATDTSQPGKGVTHAVFSPIGGRIAAISNLDTDDYRVVIAKSKDVSLADATTLDVAACDVAWRGDGAELLAVTADPACAATTGRIVRFAPGRPWQLTLVARNGSRPRYGADPTGTG